MHLSVQLPSVSTKCWSLWARTRIRAVIRVGAWRHAHSHPEIPWVLAVLSKIEKAVAHEAARCWEYCMTGLQSGADHEREAPVRKPSVALDRVFGNIR